MGIKYTSFAGDAVILGEERYVEFKDADDDGEGNRLTLFGISPEEAERILDLVEFDPTAEAAKPDKPTAPATPAAKSSAPKAEAAKPTEDAKPATGRGRKRVEKAPEDTKPSEPASSPKHTNGAANGVANGAAATHVPATRAMPPDIVQEIRGAFGVNPALLLASHKVRLVQMAVEEGVIDEPEDKYDLDAVFYALGAAVPKGWFAEHAEAAKGGKAAKKPATKAAPPPADEEDEDDVEVEAAPEDEDEEPEAPPAKPAARAKGTSAKDPAGLTANGDEDPDEAPVRQPPKAAKPKKGATASMDMDALKGFGRLRDVLGHLYDAGFRTAQELVDVCADIQQDVPVLARVANIDERVRRTAEVMGLDFGAQASA